LSLLVGSVQIIWFRAKLNDLIQSSAVSAEALLKQFEKHTVRCFVSLKTRSTAFRFPCIHIWNRRWRRTRFVCDSCYICSV